MSRKQAYVEIEKRASGQVRVRVLPSDAAPVSVSRHRRDFINSGEFPDCAEKVRSGYGILPRRTEFGANSKKCVREYSAAIERGYSKGNCRFVTATFPGSAEGLYEQIARWSGWITAQVNQWLRDVSPFTDFVYVWELQQRGALHLHYLIANHDKKRLRIVQRRFKTFWKGLCDTLSVKCSRDVWEKSNGDSWRTKKRVVRTAVQAVKKSVSAYLAKYLSKSQSKRTSGADYCPSRWWGASQGARLLSKRFSAVVRSVLLPIDDAWRVMEAVTALPSVAAVPVFSYVNQYSPLARGLVVCGSASSVDSIFEACLSVGLAVFVESAILKPQSRTPEPPLSLDEAARVFDGCVLSPHGQTYRREAPPAVRYRGWWHNDSAFHFGGLWSELPGSRTA